MEGLIERTEILLLIAAIVSMGVRRLRLPYTVGLVVAGLLLSLAPAIPTLKLTQELIFKAFLPPLIFEAAFQMEWKQLRREMPTTVTLATIGVLLSAGVAAAGAHYLLGWSWGPSVVVAVLLSATDPVSVIATFRDLGVKGRLQMLVESESLFNDGTAAVLFGIALAAVGGSSPTAVSVGGGFVVVAAGGILCGLAVGGLTLLLAGRTDDHLVEITFTSIAAFGSFLVAEHFHLSGVLATLSAGVLLGNVGSLGAISDKGREAVESFWEYAGFVANSLIFLLIGISLAATHLLEVVAPTAILVALLIAGRALAVYGCSAVFACTRHKLEWAHQHVLFWGGLRGALALALVLGLPADFERRQELLSVTFGVVAFSVIVQGLTMPPLLKFLGIGSTKEASTTAS